MIAMPISTPSAMRPAVMRKSFPPLAAGAADALAVTEGLATATTDRVADGVGVGVALAVDAGVAVRDAVGLALIDGGVVTAGDGLDGFVAGGNGDEPAVPSDAHARESLTPGADAQTERAGVTHALPSAAVRESDTRMKG
jgi:hypothetical protein